MKTFRRIACVSHQRVFVRDGAVTCPPQTLFSTYCAKCMCSNEMALTLWRQLHALYMCTTHTLSHGKLARRLLHTCIAEEARSGYVYSTYVTSHLEVCVESIDYFIIVYCQLILLICDPSLIVFVLFSVFGFLHLYLHERCRQALLLEASH